MTLEVRTVNLLLETHGGARRQGGATWYLSESFQICYIIYFAQSVGPYSVPRQKLNSAF